MACTKIYPNKSEKMIIGHECSRMTVDVKISLLELTRNLETKTFPMSPDPKTITLVPAARDHRHPLPAQERDHLLHRFERRHPHGLDRGHHRGRARPRAETAVPEDGPPAASGPRALRGEGAPGSGDDLHHLLRRRGARGCQRRPGLLPALHAGQPGQPDRQGPALRARCGDFQGEPQPVHRGVQPGAVGRGPAHGDRPRPGGGGRARPEHAVHRRPECGRFPLHRLHHPGGGSTGL